MSRIIDKSYVTSWKEYMKCQCGTFWPILYVGRCGELATHIKICDECGRNVRSGKRVNMREHVTLKVESLGFLRDLFRPRRIV